MLISCPNCKTSFAVPAKALGASGRTLKCSKCANTWFQEPANFSKDKLNEMLSIEAPKEEENRQLPVKVKREPVVYYRLLVLLLLTVLAFYIQKLKDSEFSGVEAFQKVAFSNIEVKSDINDNKYNYIITGDIVNSSTTPVKIQPITVKIYGKGRQLIKEDSLSLDQQMIAPKSSYSFTINLDNLSMASEQIVIESRHWLEKIFVN